MSTLKYDGNNKIVDTVYKEIDTFGPGKYQRQLFRPYLYTGL